jgi:hypothetical protein
MNDKTATQAGEEKQERLASLRANITQEIFLGDGLFASYDGFQFKLRAPRGMMGDHEVFLEPSVMNGFEKYVDDTRKKMIEYNSIASGELSEEKK